MEPFAEGVAQRLGLRVSAGALSLLYSLYQQTFDRVLDWETMTDEMNGATLAGYASYCRFPP